MNIKEYLKRNKIKQITFYKELGITYQYFNAICRGKRKPSIKLALLIEEKTHGAVSLREWFPKRNK